jgi:MFS family permease
VGGLGAFAIGAFAASFAPGLGTLIVARVLQGLGAAAAVPSALALIGTLYPPGRERTRALALLAAMASLGTMTGLVLGGAVTDLLGWPWLFATAALAAAATLAAPRLLPEARAQGSALRLDALGAVLVTAALVAILFALTRIERHGVVSVWVVMPLLGGLGLMTAFVTHERRAASPLLPLAILRVRSLRAASLGAGLNAVAFTAIVYVGTLYLQLALGYSPLQAGLALLPLDAVAFVVPLAGARAIARRAPRTLLYASFTLTALALLWLARTPIPAEYVRDVLGPLLILGASLSVAFVVLTQEAVADVEARRTRARLRHLRDRQPPLRRRGRRRALRHAAHGHRDGRPRRRIPQRLPGRFLSRLRGPPRRPHEPRTPRSDEVAVRRLRAPAFETGRTARQDRPFSATRGRRSSFSQALTRRRFA